MFSFWLLGIVLLWILLYISWWILRNPFFIISVLICPVMFLVFMFRVDSSCWYLFYITLKWLPSSVFPTFFQSTFICHKLCTRTWVEQKPKWMQCWNLLIFLFTHSDFAVWVFPISNFGEGVILYRIFAAIKPFCFVWEWVN